MKIQSDSKVRDVAMTNLIVMCDRISGTCHTFEVIKVSPHRVLVEYSNPDEYGNPDPVVAHYPCFPSGFDSETPLVVLQMVRCTNDPDDTVWQCFDQLNDMAPLFRSGDSTWETEYEIRVKNHPEFVVTSTWDKDGCIQTYHCHELDFPSWDLAQSWVAAQMHEIDFAPKTL